MAIALLAALVVGAASAHPNRATRAQAPVKVALLLPCPTNDGSWCQAAYTAAKKLQQQGVISLSYTQNAPQDTASASQLMERYASNGAQLVIADSSWADAAAAFAKKFPNTPVVYAGGGAVSGNISTFEEPIYIPAYLAGMLAAGITKSKVIGGLAAFDIPLCHAEMSAFGAGAKAVNPAVKELVTYTGDWNDSAKGKSAVQTQAGQKADVFVACGGGPDAGLISALQANPSLSAFSYVGNENAKAPKQMVASLVYDLYPIFKAIVADVANGTYKGKDYNLGGKSFDLVTNSKYTAAKIPPSIVSMEKAKAAAILAGKFTVPYVAK
jgi:basic membrane lipoprotein Med (substrate-binding protein (PBP1-ABC) superfamily)